MRTATVLLVTAAVGATTVLAAAPAQARRDPIQTVPAQAWVQSFQRASADAPCVPPKELDIAWQADWPAAENTWIPTWEQWPNGGKGGWTCLRIITWAPAQYEQILF
jgi:hypothetical protein